MIQEHFPRRRLAGALAALLMLPVFGCQQPPTGLPDYRAAHPVEAVERLFVLDLAPGRTAGPTLSASEAGRIEAFARDYIRRGRGPILVAHVGTDAELARIRRSDLLSVLASEGVPEDDVYFQVRNGSDGAAGGTRLSYAGYAVRVPDCGDWSGQTGFDPTNHPHTDFGCSFQRNTGLMLSNPGDLTAPGRQIEHDTAASDRVIRTYRAGQRLGTDKPRLEQKEFSEIK